MKNDIDVKCLSSSGYLRICSIDLNWDLLIFRYLFGDSVAHETAKA